MAVNRYCPHGNLRASCSQCKLDALDEAKQRAAENRARGESGVLGRIEGAELPYPWQRDALKAWQDGGRTGFVALSLGLPIGDLPFAVVADVSNSTPGVNVLVATAPGEADALRQELASRFGLRPATLMDHHFLEPRDDGVLLVADIEELSTIDLSGWGRFASNGLLVLLDADGVNPALGNLLSGTAFRHRFVLSRLPSAIDLISSRPWARAYGPMLYRATEEEARDLNVLPRIDYRLHVEMLRPESSQDSGRNVGRASGSRHGNRRGPQQPRFDDRPEGPWEPADYPIRLPSVPAGPFLRSRARDVAVRRAKETPNLVVVHDGVAVPGAAATLRLADLPDRHDPAPAGWVLTTPQADFRAILRLATVAWKTLQAPGLVEDAVVLPVPIDLCRQPPWSEAWRTAANQVDRAVAGLLLARKPGDAMLVEDLESLVGVALALRGLPAEELYRLTPVVADAAAAAHAGERIPPEKVQAAARAVGGLAAALLVAASAGPLHLLRIAHPRFSPVTPDLPHPSLYDARRHAWRGRAFAALAQAAAKGDAVTAWGRYPELRFVFPSSALLDAATAYCQAQRIKGPLDDEKFTKIEDRTRIAPGDRVAAKAVLTEWNAALRLAEEHEREFLADMHARQPERERRREGVALTNVAVAERGGDTINFESREGRLPRTNIAPGSEVAIVEAGGREEVARGLVSKISTRRITVEFPGGAPRGHLPRLCTINLVFDAKVFEAYQTAITGAVRAMQASQPVDDSPDGLLRAALLGETEDARPQSIQAPTLTSSQKEAIEAVLSGGRVRLIHGPPGTGKTHTLVHLAMALARAGHSVLVTADSNAAVDNLVVGLRRNGSLVVRVGHAVNLRDEAAEAARIDPLDAPLFVRWAAEQGIVVATTNYGAFRYIDPKGGMTPFLFDYVIHDEAGQSTAPSSLAAMMRGRRLVLAGDPKQLPPTVVSMDAKEAGLDVTLFERIEELTGRSRTRMLRTQFRMREPIVAFSNQRYYEGRIETDAAAAAQAGLADLPAFAFQHVTGRENDRQRNGSISNDFEVEAVAALVDQFRAQCRENGWTMAVLTPYQAQRESLRRRLPDLEVSTVDGAQGREWDVVLYSSVRSNPQHRLGFLEDERRLNVAVTRARRNFVLVGDERTLRDNPAFSQMLDGAEKVRLHYPNPPQQGAHGGRHERRERQDRRGRDGRGPRDPRREGGRRDDRRPDGGNAVRPADRPADRADDASVGHGGELLAPRGDGPAGDPSGEGGGRRRRRRRGRRGRGMPEGWDSEDAHEARYAALRGQADAGELRPASRIEASPTAVAPAPEADRPAPEREASVQSRLPGAPEPAPLKQPRGKKAPKPAEGPAEPKPKTRKGKAAKTAESAPVEPPSPKKAKGGKAAKVAKAPKAPKAAAGKEVTAQAAAAKPKKTAKATKAAGDGRCKAVTKAGAPCRNAGKADGLCALHSR